MPKKNSKNKLICNEWNSQANIRTNISKNARDSISSSFKNNDMVDFKKEKSEIFKLYNEIISVIENENDWKEFLLSLNNQYTSISQKDLGKIVSLLFEIKNQITCRTNMSSKWDIIRLSKHNIEIPRNYEKLMENIIEKSCFILYNWNAISLDKIKELYIKESISYDKAPYETTESNKNFLAYLARSRFWEELNKNRETPFTFVHFTTEKWLNDILKDKSIKALWCPWTREYLSSDRWLTRWQGRIYGIIPEKLNQKLRNIKKRIEYEWHWVMEAHWEMESSFDSLFYSAGLQKLPNKAIVLDIKLSDVGIVPDLIERGGSDSYIYWSENNEEYHYYDSRNIESYIIQAPMKSRKRDYNEKNLHDENFGENYYRVPRKNMEINLKQTKNVESFNDYKDAVFFIAKRLDQEFRHIFCKKMLGNKYNSREISNLW